MRFYMYGTVEVAYDMILNLQTIRKRGGATLMMKSNCHTTKGTIKKTAIENVLLTISRKNANVLFFPFQVSRSEISDEC
jgi:hypothetical protein